MKAAIYCRVSTDEQKENTSLDGQQDACMQYASFRGWDVAKIYRDDYSGSKIDRPELQRMLADMRGGQFNAIIVNEISRWGRDEQVLLDLKTFVIRAGIELHFVGWGRNIDFANPLDKYMYQSMGNFAVMWKDIIVKNFRDGKINKAKSKQKPVMVGCPPYGYRKVGIGKNAELVIDEQEAFIVRKIFEWYTQGDEFGQRLSLRAIAIKLQEMNVPTHQYKKVTAKYWIPSTIRGMMMNPIYAGITHYGKSRIEEVYTDTGKHKKRLQNPKENWIEIPVPYLAIIDKETFELAQTIGQKNLAQSSRNQRNEYLLTGFFRCGGCDSAMAGSFTIGGNKNKVFYYRCGNHWHALRNNPCPNEHKSVNKERADAVIWDWLVKLWSDEESFNEGVIGMREKREAELQPKLFQLEHIKSMIAEQDKAIARYMKQLGAVDNDEMAAIIQGHADDALRLRNKYKKDAQQLELEINGIQFTPEDEANLRELIVKIRDGIANPKPGMSLFQAKRQVFNWVNLKVEFVADENGKRLEATCGLTDDYVVSLL